MSGSVGNLLTTPQPGAGQQQTLPTPMPARPVLQNPAARWGPAAQPAVPAGPRLPGYALRVPAQPPANPLMPAPAFVPPRVRTIHPPEGPRSTYGLEHQVSTRIPTNPKQGFDPHTRSDLKIDYDSMRPDLENPKEPKQKIQKYNEAIQRMREFYPHIDTTNMSNHEAAEAFMGHVHDNIVGLWNQVRDKPWLHEAVHWYWGANRYAKELADEFRPHVAGGLTHRQAAAAIAALSPQTDWNQNVNRVERMLTIMRDHKETAFNPEMRDWVKQKIEARKDKNQVKAGLDELARIPENAKFKDISEPLHQAYFARAHDELYNRDRSYPIISPINERFPHPLMKSGKPPGIGWGSFDELENAFHALKSDDLKNISEALGLRHKVRSFYNNIIAPDSPEGHVTIDTHAINAGLMRPMGSKHDYVTHGLGAGMPKTNLVNAHGLYALYADAYRRAAQTISRQEGRRYLPREVQSATWEAIKGMFDNDAYKGLHLPYFDAKGRQTGEIKNRVADNPEAGEPLHHVGKIAKHYWNLARFGVVTPADARRAVTNAAGGISPPQWLQLRQAPGAGAAT